MEPSFFRNATCPPLVLKKMLQHGVDPVDGPAAIRRRGRCSRRTRREQKNAAPQSFVQEEELLRTTFREFKDQRGFI